MKKRRTRSSAPPKLRSSTRLGQRGQRLWAATVSASRRAAALVPRAALRELVELHYQQTEDTPYSTLAETPAQWGTHRLVIMSREDKAVTWVGLESEV